MTYKELKNELEGFSEEELSQDAMFYSDTEFYPIASISPIEDSDVVDEGQYVLFPTYQIVIYK